MSRLKLGLGTVFGIVGLLLAVIVSLFSQNWIFILGYLAGFVCCAIAMAVDRL